MHFAIYTKVEICYNNYMNNAMKNNTKNNMKNTTYTESAFYRPWRWQNDAGKKILKAYENANGEDAIVMSVASAVGTGKTVVAAEAFRRFMVMNPESKTVSFFVSPRIRLCDQQCAELTENFVNRFNLQPNVDFAVVPVHSDANIYNKRDEDAPISQHTVFVICDESLWGHDKNTSDPLYRYNVWMRKFAAWKNLNGIKFGAMFFDESHNYVNNQELMFGRQYDIVDEDIEHTRDIWLGSYFNLMMLASGTPAAYQNNIGKSKAFKKYTCGCSVKEAIEKEYIAQPTLNLACTDMNSFLPAIMSIMHREQSICENEVFKPYILICMPSINDVNGIVSNSYIQSNIGKLFHVISIHSEKIIADKEGNIDSFKSTIDGKTVKPEIAYRKIESLNDKGFGDNLPVLVFQVDMIGEGININSFNSVITMSNSEIKCMQQIGRVLRNYRLGDKNKIENGHASIYCLYDNLNNIARLMSNLKEFGLDADCFDWGAKIDMRFGSGVAEDPDGVANDNVPSWEEIDPLTDVDIIEVLNYIDVAGYRHAKQELVDSIITDKEIAKKFESIVNDPEVRRIINCMGVKVSDAKLNVTVVKNNKASKKASSNNTKETVKKQSKTTVDILYKFISMISAGIHSSKIMHDLWKDNVAVREILIENFLKNKMLAKFFIEHFSVEFWSKLA